MLLRPFFPGDDRRVREQLSGGFLKLPATEAADADY